MKQANVEQRSQQWLDWRKCGVSASDAAVILGQSSYKSRWQLWAEKSGVTKEADLSANPHVLRGFERQKQGFLAQYDQHIQEWVTEHPDFVEAIRRAVPEVQQVSQLGNTLRDEISRDAQALFEQTFSGKQKVSRKALKPILRLRDWHLLIRYSPGGAAAE